MRLLQCKEGQESDRANTSYSYKTTAHTPLLFVEVSAGTGTGGGGGGGGGGTNSGSGTYSGSCTLSAAIS